jgi:hypothetical protein
MTYDIVTQANIYGVGGPLALSDYPRRPRSFEDEASSDMHNPIASRFRANQPGFGQRGHVQIPVLPVSPPDDD